MPTFLTNLAAVCQANPADKSKELNDFFGFPTWWKYLKLEPDAVDPTKCVPHITKLGDLWAVGFAIIEILLRIGGLVAVGYVLYGAFLYMTSQGEPDKTSGAKNTIMNAIIGLVIVIVAVTVVSFIGSRFKTI